MAAATGLNWRGATGNILAHGKSALYTIQSLAGGQHVLQGIAPDGSPVVDFGPLGEQFASLEDAMRRAEEFDNS